MWVPIQTQHEQMQSTALRTPVTFTDKPETRGLVLCCATISFNDKNRVDTGLSTSVYHAVSYIGSKLLASVTDPPILFFMQKCPDEDQCQQGH